jgi:hypothetical protein
MGSRLVRQPEFFDPEGTSMRYVRSSGLTHALWRTLW